MRAAKNAPYTSLVAAQNALLASRSRLTAGPERAIQRPISQAAGSDSAFRCLRQPVAENSQFARVLLIALAAFLTYSLSTPASGLQTTRR